MPDLIIPPFQPTDSPSPSQHEPVDYADYSDFTRGVLSSIPEDDRPVVAKYIKDWDGNVTRKFQEIHSQYRPYLELGDIEDIQYAKYYTSMMQNDPAKFIRELTTAMRDAGMSTDDLFVNDEQYENYQPGQEPPQNDPMVRELLARQEQYEQMLGNVYQQQQQFQQSQVEQQQIGQLDRLMHDMHTQHGDFDDDWFLLQLEKGATPNQAINAYKERFGSPERKPAPRLLNGNGAVRQDQVDPSRLSDSDRKAYALAILQANTQS
jgi:hypothetical protein